jgi:hypothetical protein
MLQKLLNSRFECWQIITHHRPNHLRINPVIFMANDIADGPDIRPSDLRLNFQKVSWNMPYCF